MPKSNPLSKGLKQISQPVAAAVSQAPVTLEEPAHARSRSPARAGQTLIGGFFSPEVHRQLKVMAAEQGKTQQALLADALNMLFAQHGKPEIATLGRILRASS